ncbi:MAG: RluA family pseudouridine synthase [Spirochaetales bacterium]|nr:RluA family pseudouridine synthase [Spirochaetales bacterium]
MKNNTFIIKENDAGRRIDRIIRKMYPGIPLSRIYKAFRKGEIRLNKQKVNPAATVRSGDILTISKYFLSGIDTALVTPITCGDITSRKIPGRKSCNNTRIFDHSNTEYKSESESSYRTKEVKLGPFIVFENDHILALNKPAGLLIHGEISLEKMVKTAITQAIPLSLSFTPGPVHRLDRNTSGLVFFSKSLKGARILSELFKKNLCEKYYLGLFDGRIEKETRWVDRVYRDKKRKKTYPTRDPEAPEAMTTIKPLFILKKQTLALCMIHTGITHQIRAQGMIHGHPLTGDKKYGSRTPPVYKGHSVLHSWGIRFHTFHRIIGRTSIFAPISPELYKILQSLCGKEVFKTTISGTQNRIQRGNR